MQHSPRVVETPQARCRFGYARADITPPVGMYHRMWGAAAHDRSEGIHRPLEAAVVALGPIMNAARDQQQLLIELDHCLLGAPEADALVRRVAAAGELPGDQVTLTFSHTHAAGLLSDDRRELPGGDLIEPYLEQMTETIQRIAREALDSQFEATWSFAGGRCDLAANRDYWDDKQGHYVCGLNPEAPADDRVLVVRITDANQVTRATLVNYACHPTTLAWDNRLVSPDYPGAMREVVERATGVPCLFVQGASGDLGPRDGFVGDVAVADRNGRQLGYAAMSALESLPPPSTSHRYAGPVVSGATIGTWQHEPLSAEREADVARWSAHRFSVTLDYRTDRATAKELKQQRADLQRQEDEARRGGHADEAARLRALVERQSRMLKRLEALPPDGFSYEVAGGRMGDALWVAVPGEPYNVLQTELRRRLQPAPVLIATLAGGWGPSYLPPQAAYETDVYQQTVTALAPGSLERVIDDVARQMATW